MANYLLGLLLPTRLMKYYAVDVVIYYASILLERDDSLGRCPPKKSTNMNHQLNQPLVEENPCIYIYIRNYTYIYSYIYIFWMWPPPSFAVANEGLGRDSTLNM